jgi:2-polyprenyl-3-methyl-5-hydroxy-6-metoxy-1,4-benzoquinol methylase
MTKAAVRRVVPRPLRRLVRKTYHETRAQIELLFLKRAHRRRYGRGFVYVVDERDEMYRFAYRHWNWPHHVVSMADPCYALRTYLVGGELTLSALEEVLRDLGRPIHQVRSFLDFACGHGRLTRFLVQRLDRRRITVSDINQGAVDFTRSTFGVDGFYSTEDASDLVHDRRYEIIFVASLFSHLSVSQWGPWLKRLYALLDDGGLLVFSTHGPSVLEIYGEEAKAQVETKAEGYSFLRTNETEGRLAAGYYGSAFVTESYVESFVIANALGKLVACYPGKLWDLQDVYILERMPTQVGTAAPALGAGRPAENRS